MWASGPGVATFCGESSSAGGGNGHSESFLEPDTIVLQLHSHFYLYKQEHK